MVNVDKIRLLAKEQGITLAFLASKIGTPRTYFSDIKNKNRDIPESRLSVVADLLHTTTDYLRDETDIKEKAAPNEQLLTENQRELIAIADRLSDEDYQKVLEYVEFLISKRNS